MEILNRDFRGVLKQYNSKDVFIYADCPYLGTEDYYENVFTPKDHEDLASMLKCGCVGGEIKTGLQLTYLPGLEQKKI